MPTIGAGILHYRFWPEVRPTLDSLLGQTRPPDFTFVLDNGSQDGSTDALREAYPQLSVGEVTDNVGPVGGMNLILDQLLDRDLDMILLLTHETVMAPDALAALAARLAEGERLGVVGPLLGYRSAPDRLWSAGGIINPRTWDIDHVLEPAEISAWRGAAPRPAQWLDGACLLFRAEAVRSVGRLHEAFFMMFDEPDFQLRLQAAGWEIECVPAALARQEPGNKPDYVFTRNRLGFLARRAPRRVLVRGLGTVCAGIVRDCVHPRPGRGGRWHALMRARGVLDFARNRWGRPAPRLVSRAP